MLAVQVYRWSDGTWLEKQDMWNLSGIFRDVYLWSSASTQTRDIDYRAELSSTYDEAQVNVRVNLRRLVQSAAEVTVAAELGGERLDTKSVALDPCGNAEVELTGTIEDPALWSAESPNLHNLVVAVEHESERDDFFMQRVGFRDVAIRNGVLQVNGKRVLMRGANRHEHNPDTGHYVSEEQMIKDIELLKQNNFNAVRPGHYPLAHRWYELADEYGLYMVDEANLESHGLWQELGIELGKRPEWEPAHRERVERMVEQDKNHPSIIIWSMGNEAGSGETFDHISDWLHERDPTRVVSYEGSLKGGPGIVAEHSDIQCPMYWGASQVEHYASQQLGRPIILIEYAHAMANSTGNMREYWDLFYAYEGAQGGFVWDWIDQGIRLPVPGSEDETFFAFGGDVGPAAPVAEGFTGIYGNNFCMNGLLRSDQAPNPGIAVLKHVMQPVLVEPVNLSSGTVRVTNRYDHIDWSTKLVGRYAYMVDGTPIDEGEIELPSLQPGESAEISVPIIEIAIAPGAEPRLQLSFQLAEDETWAEAGHELAWADFLMPSAVPGPPIDPSQAAALNLVDGETSIDVSGTGFSVRIDKASGALVSFELDDTELLTEPLRPHFWRAMTDNDLGNSLRSNSGRWEEVGDALRATSIDIDSSDDKESVITAELRADGLSAELTLQYRVFASGEVGVELAFEPTRSLPEMPRFGMRVALADELDQVQWMGPGPEPSYPDRLLLPVGLYEGTVAEQFVPYARAQESGNKADARFIALRNSSGRGLLAVGAPLLSANALPFSTEAIDAAKHPHELEANGKIHLNLDRAQRGVGGDNSWGRAPLREYRLPADAQSYRYWLRGLRSGDEPSELARRELP